MALAIRRLALALLLLAIAVPTTPVAVERVQAQAAVRAGSMTLTAVGDWQCGTSEGLLVSNNEAGDAGGELRLSDDTQQGAFLSNPLPAVARQQEPVCAEQQAPFAVNAVGATWQAEIPEGTGLLIEVRAAPAADGPWSEWQALVAGDARSQDDGAFASESLRVLPLDTKFMQVRASFTSEVQRASAILSGLTLHYYDSLAGPASAVGLRSVPLAYGPEVTTQRPLLVRRADWSRDEAPAGGAFAAPRAIVLHQTGSLGSSEALTTTGQPLMVLRALAEYQSEALGWGDLIYHYVIDRDGNLYESRHNGPGSEVTQLAVGEPAVHVALISDFGETPTTEARATLGKLVAWLGQAYGLPPLGQHSVKVGGQSVARPNFVAHSEVVTAAADPGEPTRNLMPELRQQADNATVRTRYYFPEGNPQDFEMRFALFNSGMISTTARLLFLRQGQDPVSEEVPLDAGTRSDVVVNDIFNDSPDTATIVEASQPLIVERVMRRTTSVDGQEVAEIDGSIGVRQLARVWYFAEGSTDGDFETFVVLFNPQGKPANTTLTYMLGDSRVVTQTLQVPARSRSVVRASDTVRNAGFGLRVLSNEPIAAERTMIFGSGGQGFHTSPGQLTLSRRWLFAEGTTQSGFEMRMLLLNPGDLPADAELTFATPDGTSLRRRYALPPTSRIVVNVNDVVPDLGVSVQVNANRPIMAERALYFNAGNAGTASVGTPEAAYSWRFADGRTRDNDQMFLLVSNPSKGQARVTVDVLLDNGTVESEGFIMPGNARYTFAVHEFFPGQSNVAAIVRATQPVVVERSLFRDGGRGGGYTTLGVPVD